MSRVRSAEKASQLVGEGYAIFEDAFDAGEVAVLRAGIEQLYATLGSPPCYSAEPRVMDPTLHVATTGLIIATLVERRPDFAPRILKPDIVDAMRRVLGDDMYLELTAAVVTDSSRAFLAWHTHIGGQDDRAYRLTRNWPDVPKPRRFSALLYLDDLSDDNGPLLVHPRAAGGPTAPPHDPTAEQWEGEIVVRAARGTVVAMDECTWHAARRKKTPGLRILLGCNFAAADAPRSPLIEHSLREQVDGGALLKSVLPPPA